MQSEYGFKTALHKVFFVFVIVLSTSVAAQKIELKPPAIVEFDAIGKPAMINIKGTGAKATGVLNVLEGIASGEFTLNLKEFTTDMDMRDEHMKEKYLEVNKKDFDKAVLRINHKVADLSIPLSGEWSPKDLKGTLILHGVSKEIPLVCRLNIKDGKAEGDVLFKIKVQDFRIEIPSFAGITMADEVAIKVRINHKVAN